MAKKSVATLQTGSKRLTKAIKMVKKGDAKSYSFVETITGPDQGKRLVEQTIKQLFQIVLKKSYFYSSFFYTNT